MREVQILEVARAEKGRVRIRFSDGVTAELYGSAVPVPS